MRLSIITPVRSKRDLVVWQTLLLNRKSYGQVRLLRKIYMSTKSLGIKVCWSKPSATWVKVNVDGAAKGSTRHAGAACVLRDHKGNWITGTARN